MKRKKNQGFTLVELLVSIAVLSIVTLGIGGLLRLAAEQYSNATKETEVQNILQQATASVSSSMEDAELGVFFSGNTLTIANREKYIKFEKVGTVLYYDEKEYEDAVDDDEKINEAKSASVGHAQENILADHVNTFSVAIPEVLPDGKTGFAVLSLAIQFQERHKDIVQNVFFRNYLSESFTATSTVASAATPVYTSGNPASTTAPTSSTTTNPTTNPTTTVTTEPTTEPTTTVTTEPTTTVTTEPTTPPANPGAGLTASASATINAGWTPNGLPAVTFSCSLPSNTRIESLTITFAQPVSHIIQSSNLGTPQLSADGKIISVTYTSDHWTGGEQLVVDFDSVTSGTSTIPACTVTYVKKN
ncbi:MAG: type II secretion system protein [Lachnospiraceae bacterium]|nr:type II secretion system protein [Lachnospiraceae bacterium]